MVTCQEPYTKGILSVLTTSLRKIFPKNKYLGVELEVNNKFFLNNKPEYKNIKKGILSAIKNTLGKY